MGDHIEGVGHENRTAGHIHGTVEKAVRIGIKGLPVSAGMSAQVPLFSKTFPGTEKNGQQEDTEKEPFGYSNTECLSPRKQAKQEPGGDAEDIEEGVVLEPEGITPRNRQVRQEQKQERGGNEIAKERRRYQQQTRHPAGDRNRYRSGRKRAEFLHRMGAVLLNIDDVVEDIDRA